VIAALIADQHASAAASVIVVSEPLSLDAEQIYQSLSDADATAANAFLSGGLEPAPARQRYNSDITQAAIRIQAASALVGPSVARTEFPGTLNMQASAVGSATGDDLATLSAGLPVYTGEVETARADNADQAVFASRAQSGRDAFTGLAIGMIVASLAMAAGCAWGLSRRLAVPVKARLPVDGRTWLRMLPLVLATAALVLGVATADAAPAKPPVIGTARTANAVGKISAASCNPAASSIRPSGPPQVTPGSYMAKIQDGLEARKQGDEETATSKLGRAVALAHQSGNEDTAKLLANVIDFVDVETGRVRLKKQVEGATRWPSTPGPLRRSARSSSRAARWQAVRASRRQRSPRYFST
jgi:von Willebrand factor type A C-terminal domain